MHILVISDISPYPLVSGDRIREYNLLRRIAHHHDVWLATILENPSDEAGITHLTGFCAGVEFAYIKRRHPLMHIPGLIKYGLSGKPLELKFRHSPELSRKIKNLTRMINFDLVMIINSHTALYLELLPQSMRKKSILILENIEFAQYKSIYQIEQEPVKKIRAWINYRMMHRWEPFYAQRFSQCITVSEVDRNILLKENPTLKIEIIPNGVDTQQYQPLNKNQDTMSLLLIGKMSYAPCADAAIFFSRDILPYIQKKVNNTELWIVGREPPKEVMHLNSTNVHVTGWVEDVLPYYEQASVCVVPLRAGGGTRLKILEAMALGRPVVSTSIGCEGLNVVDGENILIADHPQEFAEKTVKLLCDKNYRQFITQNARKLVENNYDWDILTIRLMKVCDQVATCM